MGLGHTESAVHEASIFIFLAKITYNLASAIQSNDVLLLREFANVMAEADVEYRKMESRIAGILFSFTNIFLVLIATMGAKHAKVNLYESDEDRLKALHDSESFDIVSISTPFVHLSF